MTCSHTTIPIGQDNSHPSHMVMVIHYFHGIIDNDQNNYPAQFDDRSTIAHSSQILLSVRPPHIFAHNRYHSLHQIGSHITPFGHCSRTSIILYQTTVTRYCTVLLHHVGHRSTISYILFTQQTHSTHLSPHPALAILPLHPTLYYRQHKRSTILSSLTPPPQITLSNRHPSADPTLLQTIPIT